MDIQTVKSNILDFFKGLEFVEDEHKYFFNSKPLSISVSGIVDWYKNPFDKDLISKAMSFKTHISQKEILKDWKNKNAIAIEEGNETHKFAESYMFDRNLSPSTFLQKAVINFWKDLPSFVIPVFPELKMYHKDFMFAGTQDILLFNTNTNKFIIVDYKTNKDLFKNYKGQKLKGPFSELLDTPFNKYQIQLSLYQILFEQTGYEVSSRKILWLLRNGCYELYDTNDYTQILKKELLWNLEKK